ncbi:hypothetical protein BGZ97_006037 [Linnemannia gamsii]|uniref:Uncharacterized protein n=1 Tax=Linnemannia gamsii TaxID=64522 RepID=A0A9P6QPS5_9FUNG|nr:hypothetical protein BGZ97_006037 [Linnemannia gamsii]
MLTLFLGEKGSARNEFDALLAASEEDMVTSALLPDNEDALIVLEKAYTAAEVKVENLYNQAAKLLASRVKVDNWPEPKRTHALVVAYKALLENSAELEGAKSAALIALNRVKILIATHIALLPVPAITAVPHDSALPSQAAIKRYSKHTSADTLLNFLSRTASAFNFIAPKAKKKRKRRINLTVTVISLLCVHMFNKFVL